MFCPLRLEGLIGLLEKVCGRKTKRGKTTTGTRSNEAPLPPRVRERGLRRGASDLEPPPVPRESENRQGPEWHPDKPPERKDARPKREINPVAAGDTDKKKKQERKVRVGVCPVTTCQ